MTPADVHVLLVDHERLSRLVVGNLFRRAGYQGRPCEMLQAVLAAYRPGFCRPCGDLWTQPSVKARRLASFRRGKRSRPVELRRLTLGRGSKVTWLLFWWLQ